MRRPAPTLVALALLLALAGCGGGGEQSASAPDATTQTAARPPAKQPSAAARRGAQPKAQAARSQRAAGAGAAVGTRTQPFERPGADNSIQEAGSEGSSSQLHRAATVLHGYFAALAAREWTRACTYTAGEIKRPACARLLAALLGAMPPSSRQQLLVARAGALRVQGKRAFLLYRGAQHTDYSMPMARQGGAWKVAALLGSALP